MFRVVLGDPDGEDGEVVDPVQYGTTLVFADTNTGVNYVAICDDPSDPEKRGVYRLEPVEFLEEDEIYPDDLFDDEADEADEADSDSEDVDEEDMDADVDEEDDADEE